MGRTRPGWPQSASPMTRTASRLRHQRPHRRQPALGDVAPPNGCCDWSAGVARRRQHASFMTSPTPAQLLNHACERRRRAVRCAGGNETLIWLRTAAGWGPCALRESSRYTRRQEDAATCKRRGRRAERVREIHGVGRSRAELYNITSTRRRISRAAHEGRRHDSLRESTASRHRRRRRWQ